MPDRGKQNTNLQFLKLGGSVITDKMSARTPRLEVIARLAREIAASQAHPEAGKLVIGNGAGSYGHVPAKKYGTRDGVVTALEWMGFAEVWRDAAALNHIVLDALQDAGLPAVSIHPSSCVIAQDGRVAQWDLAPIKAALQAGLTPIIHGDVVFDTTRGGTILSTEDLFSHLAYRLTPRRILLAGIETGVWADYPRCERLMQRITPEDWGTISSAVTGSQAADVTGGMSSKVEQSLGLVSDLPQLEIMIFSGMEPAAIYNAIMGEQRGTLITSNPK